MAKEFNEEKMRRDLLFLYERFIENPENEEVRSNLIKFDMDFGGLCAYNDYLKSQPIPEYIQNALGGLIDLGLYGEGFKNKEECLYFAKEILKELSKTD